MGLIIALEQRIKTKCIAYRLCELFLDAKVMAKNYGYTMHEVEISIHTYEYDQKF